MKYRCTQCSASTSAPSTWCKVAGCKGRMVADAGGINRRGDPEILEDVAIQRKPKILTGVEALDVALSGGVVRGFSILLSGEPGSGKSTLAQEVCAKLAPTFDADELALFATSEEDKSDVTERSHRCAFLHSRRTVVFADSSGEAVFQELERRRYRLAVLDSVQTTGFRGHTLLSSQGAIELVSEFHSWAHKNDAIAIILCQENAAGHAYGPQALSHIVDAVLSLEVGFVRRLQVFKNRKGRAPLELTVRMTDHGLELVKGHIEAAP